MSQIFSRYYDHKADCHDRFPWSNETGPTFNVVVWTIGIWILTIAIEVAAHTYKESSAGSPQTSVGDGDVNAQSSNESSPRDDHHDQDSAPRTQKASQRAAEGWKDWAKRYDSQDPSPVFRATRFLLVTIAIIPLCIMFTYRMKRTSIYTLGDCAGVIDFSEPNWTAITIFNILPFACACTAWLRTLVDCILVRFGTKAHYRYWPPVLPLFMVAFIIIFVGILFRDAIIYVLMGRPDLTVTGNPPTGRREDIEMGASGGEEGQRLMQEENAGTIDDDEDTVYSPRSSIDGKAQV
ncbi:hypothetical protein SCUP515_05182 [Seiridium cupressi]